METIYIDSLFLVNWIIDYFILLCTAKVASARIHRGWIAIGALTGSLYACICVLPGMEFASHPIVKVAAGGILCIIAFHSENQILRCTLIFFVISAGFGGILWAVSMFGGYDPGGRLLYLPINGKVLAVTFALAYAVISALFRRFEETARQQMHLVEAVFHGQTVSFTALRDTGNSLFDPLSNSKVLVCEQVVAAPLLGPYADKLRVSDPTVALSALSNIPEFAGTFRLIPFNSVGATGLLLAFRPDRITIDGKEENNILLAVTTSALSSYGEYQAIY